MKTTDTERLYQLLPAVYRLRDAEQGYPLRALVNVLARQGQVVEADIGRLYENWVIETCDEWVVPYLGDLLGVRGLPGNNINHANSYFVPNHGPRVFVANEVDMVSGPGYNPARFGPGMKNDFIDLRVIVTDLCVLDFKGPEHAIRVKSLHPGVSFEQVQAATGFPLLQADDMGETPMPTAAQLEIVRRLDPHNMRGMVIKNNPPALRATAPAA